MNKNRTLYRWYALFMLTVVYILNFVDRQILVVLQEPIKADMNLSDTQLGLLTGFLFAIFYVTLGIPIARLADRGNRRNVIVWSIGLWSAMTALSGLVTSYWQLVLARIGVGVGEAGGSPPAHSMITDYFPPGLRSVALSIFSSGIYLGIMIGFLAGGYLSQNYGWRVAFFAAGAPGLLVALLVRLTVKEPPRGQYDSQKDSGSIPGILEATRIFWKLKTFRYLSLGCALLSFSNYGVNNWMPSFIIRSYELSISETGVLFALLIGGCGCFGAVMGGIISDRLGARDQRWYMWLPGLMGLSAVPFLIGCFMSDDLTTSMLLFIWPSIATAVFLGPGIATCHALVEPRLRALISAVVFFIVNLVGLGLGPVFTGLLSDLLSPIHGPVEGLRYALSSTALVGSTAVVFFLLAARTIRSEMRNATLNSTTEQSQAPEQPGTDTGDAQVLIKQG
ncbi:MAG: spinster family MFS transporter [Endozoicomonas sp.]